MQKFNLDEDYTNVMEVNGLFRKIRWQIIVPIVSSMTVLFGLIFVSGQWVWRTNLTDDAKLIMQQDVQLMSAKINELLISKVSRLEAASQALRVFYKSNDPYVDVAQFLQSFIEQNHDQLNSVWFLGTSKYKGYHYFQPWYRFADGHAVPIGSDERDITIGGEFALNPDFDYYYGPVRTGETYFTDPYKDEDLKQPMISIGTPVYDAVHTLIGVVGLDMQLSSVQSIGDAFRKNDQSTLMLLSNDGTVLYHSNHENMFKENVLKRFEIAMRKQYEQAMRIEKNIATTTVDGVEYFMISDHIASTGWTVVMQRPVQDVLGQLDRMSVYSGIVVFLVMVLLALLSIRNVYRTIQKPIDRLMVGVERVGSGDFNYELKVDENAEMQFLAQKFNQMTRQLNDSREELQTMNEELEMTVRERTRSIHLLLNHAGQGFMSFNQKLIVDHQYSQECEVIFGKPVGGLKITELIYGSDRNQIDFFESIVDYLWCEKERGQLSVIMSLFPEEISVNQRPIEVIYKPIKNEQGELIQVMIILTDIYERKLLQQKMIEEERVIRMVVKSVTQKQDLLESMNDFRNFIEKRVVELIDEMVPIEEIVLEIKRHVHTLKGNIGRFGMVITQKNIHELEDRLSEIHDYQRAPFQKLMKEMNWYSVWGEDVQTLQEVLGASFFDEDDGIPVNRTLLLEFEHYVSQHFQRDEAEYLRSLIKNLYFRSLKEMLGKYASYSMILAGRMEKLIHPFELIGDDVLVDPEYFKAFANSLIHLFRNMIDHGIESIDHRLEKGKDEFGRIRFEMKVIGDQVEIVVADDGQGVPLEKVRRKAATLAIASESEIYAMSDEQVVYLILHDELTTKNEVTDLSGRGMGMGALKEEIASLHGGLEVRTKRGEGTLFRISLPLNDHMLIGKQENV